jgi:iron complex outermembrane recepter protein
MMKSRSARGRNISVANFVLASLATCAASLASAQQAPAPPASTDNAAALQEVVVTAQFRSENLQQTPLAITAITGDQLEERSETTLSDVASQSPNVILLPAPAGFGSSMTAQIRGVGQTDADPAVDPGVGIYIDDVYFPTLMASDFALIDLDRVEILRGPQGTLSGMDSLGGSVKLYSRKANGDNDGYIEGTYGSLNLVGFRGSGDFTIIPGQLFVRVTGMSRKNDGYVSLVDYSCSHPTDPDVISGLVPRGNSSSNCQTGTMGGTDYTALRLSLRYLPIDSVEVNWITDTTQANNGSNPETLLATPPSFFSATPFAGYAYNSRFIPTNPYQNYANFLDPGYSYTPIDTLGTAGAKNGAFYANPDDVTHSWGTSATADWKIGDGYSLKSISAYRHYNSTYGDDPSSSPIPLVLEESDFTNRQYSEELRLSGEFGKVVSFTLGGIYFDQLTTYETREDDPILGIVYGGPATPTFDFIQDDPTRVKTKAGFLNVAWNITDALVFNTGVRETSEDKTYTYERLNIDGITPFLPLSNPVDPLNGKVGEYSGTHFDYRADLDYQWSPTLMTYAEVSTGFKGGGITPRPYFPEQVISFGPETLRSFEVGMKSEWFDHTLRVNLAAFYQQYNDLQEALNAGDCVNSSGQLLPPSENAECGEYLNVANAIGKGAEAEFEYRLNGLSINATFGYLDEYYTQVKDTTSVVVGAAPPDVGKIRWSIGAQYAINLGDYGILTPRFDIAYTPYSCGDISCTPDLANQPYTITNARLSYAFKKNWSAAFAVTNLTDKLYYISRFDTGLGFLDGQIAPPREWTFSVRRDLSL